MPQNSIFFSHESAEARMLRCWCRPGTLHADDSCPDTLNLTALFRLASLHDVAAPLVQRLLLHNPRQFDAETREGLALFVEGEQLQSEKARSELVQLLIRFNTENIPLIPIKGPKLALSLYGPQTIRACRDLDFLVREADVERTLALLDSLGYRHEPGYDQRQIAALRRYSCEYILFHPQRLPVEPHWSIAPVTLAFTVDYARLWGRAYPEEFFGIACLSLAPEDELLLLCLHGAKEQWRKLKWIADIAAYLQCRPELDWTRLLRETRIAGTKRMLVLGLALAQTFFCAALPQAVTDAWEADPLINDLVGEVAAHWVQGNTDGTEIYRLSAFYWRMRERRRDKCLYVLRTLATPRTPHYRLLPLPESLYWLYYPLKLIWDFVIIPLWSCVKRLPAPLRKIGTGR